MLNSELYSEIRRIVQEESQKFADTVTERCIELIEEYSEKNAPDFLLQEEDAPCTMPVLDTVDDIISAMSESFENACRKQKSDSQNYNS